MLRQQVSPDGRIFGYVTFTYQQGGPASGHHEPELPFEGRLGQDMSRDSPLL